MRATRGAHQRLGDQQRAEAAEQQQQPAADVGVAFAERQRRELEADRAMLDTYRRSWRQHKSIGAALLTCAPHASHSSSERCPSVWHPPDAALPHRHLRDIAWWLEHVCGVNMLDYEEKAVVLCVFGGTLALIALGAYKQGAALAGLMQALGAQLARSLQQLAALAAERLHA